MHESGTEGRSQPPRRGRGRPQLLRTGQVGRPRKIYNTEIAGLMDPISVEEAMNRTDRKE